jgi:hypothetical protein
MYVHVQGNRAPDDRPAPNDLEFGKVRAVSPQSSRFCLSQSSPQPTPLGRNERDAAVARKTAPFDTVSGSSHYTVSSTDDELACDV